MKKALSKKNLWDNAPSLIRTTLGSVLGMMPPKWLLGRSFREQTRFVERAQWWSAEHAREHQLAKLREILKLAYESTQFYREMLDRIGFRPGALECVDDMCRLPTIDKATVVKHLAEMTARSVDARDVDYVSTGGTSGEPLRFYINASRSSVEYAYLITSWGRVGYTLGMPMAVLRGRIVQPNRQGVRHDYDPLLRHHYYSNFHMTDDNMQQYLRHIHRIGPCVLHAYPSSAHALAKYILAAGELAPQCIQSVILESENVHADQVQTIEDVFGVRTFSSYGHTEKCVLATQCEHSRDYHIWPTYGFFELLDEDGAPVDTPGQEGEIVGTSFINTVVPFIRYRTGDYATYVGDRCEACGREHTVIRHIKGRWPQGGLIAIDGSLVSMTALNVHDDTFRCVREYQFHQSVPGRAALCIVPSGAVDEHEQQRIVVNMNKRLQGQVELSLEIRSELVKTAQGKQPRVIQKCISSPAER